MEGTLELPALGRRMSLGTLYDCRSHQIISPGATLWDQETISKNKKVSENKSHKLTLVRSHSFNDKCKALEVDESLKASILADIVQPADSAKFLSDQLPPEGTCRLSVHSKATSVIEELPLINQLGSCKIQNSELITEGKATHVVVGILYGSNTFFVFDKTCGEKTEDDCLKSLKALVINFRSCPEEGEKPFTFDPKQASDVECKVHCDLDVEDCHFDYKAASKLLKGIPDMIKENAVPVKFFLYPLHKIDSRAARVIKVVSDGLLSQVHDFVEGLERRSACASEMAADPLCVDFPQFAEKFAFFKRMLSEFKTYFQREFARVYPLILGGSDGESVLKEMLQNTAKVSPFKLTELDAWLRSKRKELSAVSSHVKILNDIEIVKSKESLDNIVMNLDIDNVVCLTFRLAGKEEEYLRSLSLFLDTGEKSNYSFYQWYDDGSLMRFLRTKTRLFASFFRSNRQSTCTKFIVTGFAIGSSAGEDGKVGGTVLLFEGGTLAQEDFEPPSQPGKPQCVAIDHSTVKVSWSPPDKGEDGVQRYIVKFKRFRVKNQSEAIFGEVRTEKGDTCFTVKTLGPDESLEFQITAVCSVGVSPDSKSSDRVTTLPTSPPGKPHARPASASSISLEWEHPAQSGKQVTIQSYFIKYGKVVNGAVPNWQPEVGTGSSEGRFTVNKLETNVSYVFQVVAIYEPWATSLPSTESNVCATLPVSQPGKPELGNVTASSVEMKWTSPTKIGPGVKLKEYFIKYAEVEEQQSQIPEWKWKQELTYSLHDEYKLSGLLPNRTYISRVVLVLEDDYTTQSEPSVPFTTLPAGPPTDVTVEQISATDIEVSWSRPTLISQQKAIKHYRVEYQIVGVANTVEQKKMNTNDDSCTSTIGEAAQETEFKILVTSVCGEEDKLGESSNGISFTTKKLLKHEIRVNAKTLQHGNKKNGTPCILKFPLDEVCRKPHVQSFSFGEPPKMSGVAHKVIMVVGATGSGKSTLINAMVNHMVDIEQKDDFRFKIVDVDEARGSSQAHSQTQFVTSYTIYHNNDHSLPYTLTVIDTPGFGDTRGIARDEAIKDQIREFFLDSEHGIDHIDAIGFVVQASQARLTPTQKYVFDSILSVFGKDISDNIRLLVTFADQSEPPVLDAVQAADIDYIDTASAFKFNNSALFAGHDMDRKGSKNKAGKAEKGKFSNLFWKMGQENMAKFLLEIETMDAQSLLLTQEVLKERKVLEVAVQGLQRQITLGIFKLDELQRERELLEKHERDIEANKNYTFDLDVPKSKMVSIPQGDFITNCSKCHFTCHYPCRIADDKKKAGCLAIEDGECTVCPAKCAWDAHFNQPYKFEFYTVKEHRTYEEIEARYLDASGKKMEVEQVIQHHVIEIETVHACVYKLVSDTRKSVMRLEEIALKPNPLSTPEYVDVLIESEQKSHKKGWKKRVDVLREIRKEAEIMDKIMEKNYDPLLESVEKDKKSNYFVRLLTSCIPSGTPRSNTHVHTSKN